MEYIYCVLLLNGAGNGITEEKMVVVLKAGGVAEPDMDRIKALVASVDGMDIREAVNMPLAVSEPAVPEPDIKKKKVENEEATEEDVGMGCDALFK